MNPASLTKGSPSTRSIALSPKPSRGEMAKGQLMGSGGTYHIIQFINIRPRRQHEILVRSGMVFSLPEPHIIIIIPIMPLGHHNPSPGRRPRRAVPRPSSPGRRPRRAVPRPSSWATRAHPTTLQWITRTWRVTRTWDTEPSTRRWTADPTTRCRATQNNTTISSSSKSTTSTTSTSNK